MRAAASVGPDEPWVNGKRDGGLSRHALRTPLLAIRGTAELLLAGAGGPLGATARELLAASGEAAIRLERLVEPLLAVAERAGGPARRLRPVDLADLLRRRGVDLAMPRPGTRGRVEENPRVRAWSSGSVRVLAEPAALFELVELLGRISGTPLAVELRSGRRTGLVLLRSVGGGGPSAGEEERPLLLGLAGRLARLAGGRLVARGEAGVGFVLRPAEASDRCGRGPEGGSGGAVGCGRARGGAARR